MRSYEITPGPDEVMFRWGDSRQLLDPAEARRIGDELCSIGGELRAASRAAARQGRDVAERRASIRIVPDPT